MSDFETRANALSDVIGPQLTTVSKGRIGTGFGTLLSEHLAGMATPDGVQPNQSFQKFARALQILGQQMGVTSLAQSLKEKGIRWEIASDGLSIVLYVINAATQAKQPIGSIPSEKLAQPAEFEEQLFNIMDFAEGNAPGTFKQRQEAYRARESAVRDIVKSLEPPEPPNPVVQQMGSPAAAAAQAAAPQAQQPQPAQAQQPGQPRPPTQAF